MKKIFLGIALTSLSFFSFGQKIESIKITDLEKRIANSTQPLIVNFWATWCVPCLEEIPYFQMAVEDNAIDSLQLLLVSLDMDEAYPSTIEKTAKRFKITAPILWLNETNADYFCPKIDEKWSGAIPASLFINNKTNYRKFYEQQLSEEELKEALKELLEK